MIGDNFPPVPIDARRLEEFVRIAAPDVAPVVLNHGLFVIRTAAQNVIRLNDRWRDGGLTGVLAGVDEADRASRALADFRRTLPGLGIDESDDLQRIEALINFRRSAWHPPLKSEGKTNIARWCRDEFVRIATISWRDMTGSAARPGKVTNEMTGEMKLPDPSSNPYASFIATAVEPVSIALDLPVQSIAAIYTHLSQALGVGKFPSRSKIPS